MKTEERHRLQEHELRKLTLKAGEFWKQHGMKVLAVLLVVLVIGLGALIWAVSSQSAAAEGWTKMAQSRNAEQFIAIAEDYSGEPVGHWARLRAAEEHLDEGVRQAFSNRGAAVDELEEAVAQFAKLLSADLPSDKLRERALYGHARSLEALAAVVEPTQGKVNAQLGDAIAAYEKLLKTYPETIFKPVAEEQIKALQAEQTQQFVAWFRQQEPKPSDRATPQDGLPDMGADALQPPASGAGPSLPSQPMGEEPATPASPGTDQPAADPSANPPAPVLPPVDSPSQGSAAPDAEAPGSPNAGAPSTPSAAEQPETPASDSAPADAANDPASAGEQP